MTTDIKELMQSIRRRAVDAKKYAALSIYLDVDHVVALIEALEAKDAECKHLSDELRGATALATLMKIDAREFSRELEAKDARMAESEQRVKTQNRHVCELFDENTALRRQIAELQSRAETAEQALKKRSAPVGDLVMLIKVLVRGLKKTGLNSELCESAMDYLRREHLISAADCLRNNDGIQIQGGE